MQRAFSTIEILATKKSIALEYEKKIIISELECQKSNVDFLMLQNQKDVIFNQLLGDENRYMQVMLNFLSNALKFTKEFGKIKVLVLLKEIHQLQNDSLIQSKDENIDPI